jgi:hypothetical protein
VPQALVFNPDGMFAETGKLHRLAVSGTFSALGPGWHRGRADTRILVRTTSGKERIVAAHAGR